MCVFDSSAYINGQRDHYKPATFPSVWEQIGAAIEAGRILLPREVYRELTKKDDEIAKWIAQYEQLQTAPSREVQQEVGAIAAAFPKPGVRNSADPFIIAEARVRGLTVVTYEGRSFTGVPTKRWPRSMPGICRRFGVACCTLPEAFERLGFSF